jgi:hypothetical protein
MQQLSREDFNVRPMSRETREILLREELAGKVPTDPRMAHQILHTRDKGICGICGTPVDWALRHPHPGSASMDHIIHKSRRGCTHTWENLRLAHRQCNLERNRFEVAPETALVKLRKAICQYTHAGIYLGLKVKRASADVDRLEIELEAYRAAVFPTSSAGRKRVSTTAASMRHTKATPEDVERTERYLAAARLRLKALLKELAGE